MKHFSCCSWLLTGVLVASLPALAQTPPTSSATAANWWTAHAVLGSVLAGGLGFVLGVWFMRRWARKHYHQIIHQVRLKTREEAEHAASLKKGNTVKPPTDYELKLREENTVLKQQVETLKQQLASKTISRKSAPFDPKSKRRWPTEAELAPTADTPPAPLAAAAPPLPAEPDADFEMLIAPVSVPAAEPTPAALAPTEELAETELPAELPVVSLSTTRYAPAQETGFLRDSKLATEPLPQLPLLLTLCADDPDKAFFTLSPHVNQAKLIGDGLHQLSEFFEFDLPTGRIAAVSADAPGQLARQGDGWQVVSRARLLVH